MIPSESWGEVIDIPSISTWIHCSCMLWKFKKDFLLKNNHRQLVQATVFFISHSLFLQDILGYFDLFYFSPFQFIGDCLRFHSHNSTTPVSPYFIITVVVVCLYSFNKIIQRMFVLWLHSGDAKCSGRLLMYNFAKPKQSIKTKKSRLKKLTSSASILKLHPYHT